MPKKVKIYEAFVEGDAGNTPAFFTNRRSAERYRAFET
jgi:hypothetical protein